MTGGFEGEGAGVIEELKIHMGLATHKMSLRFQIVVPKGTRDCKDAHGTARVGDKPPKISNTIHLALQSGLMVHSKTMCIHAKTWGQEVVPILDHVDLDFVVIQIIPDEHIINSMRCGELLGVVARICNFTLEVKSSLFDLCIGRCGGVCFEL